MSLVLVFKHIHNKWKFLKLSASIVPMSGIQTLWLFGIVQVLFLRPYDYKIFFVGACFSDGIFIGRKEYERHLKIHRNQQTSMISVRIKTKHKVYMSFPRPHAMQEAPRNQKRRPLQMHRLFSLWTIRCCIVRSVGGRCDFLTMICNPDDSIVQ